MPNHCHNDLYIDGPKEQVDALLSLIGADQEELKFDFNTILPYPAQFADRDREYKELGRKEFAAKYGEGASNGYNSGGYEWCSENWGTKWSAYEVARRDYLGVCVTFQTAWSPPNPVIVALHNLFPTCTLRLEYFEKGAAFAGGFSLMSESDWYEDDPWAAGTITGQWEATYGGHRGG